MAEEDYEISDPRDSSRKLRITVRDGVWPTPGQALQMFDEAYGKPKPNAKPPKPVTPAPPEAAPQGKPKQADVAPPMPSPAGGKLPLPSAMTGLTMPGQSSIGFAGATERIPDLMPAMQRKQPVSELTALTPKERATFRKSVTPEQEFGIRVNNYISDWLTGQRPESLAFQKFVDYATAPNEQERQRRIAGVSEVGKAAFKKYYASMSEENRRRIAELGAGSERLIGGLPPMTPTIPDYPFGPQYPITPQAFEAASRLTAQAATSVVTGQPFESALPLGFDPRGGLLPVAGTGSVTSPGQYLRSEFSNLVRPDSLAMMAAAGPVLGKAATFMKGATPAVQRGMRLAFTLANVPGMIGAIKQGDPDVIATSGLFAFAPDILGFVVPKTAEFVQIRRLQDAVRKANAAYEARNPGVRERSAVSAVQEGVDLAEPDFIPTQLPKPEDSPASVLEDMLSTASSNAQAAARVENVVQGAAEATVPPVAPGVAPEVPITPAGAPAPEIPVAPRAEGIPPVEAPTAQPVAVPERVDMGAPAPAAIEEPAPSNRPLTINAQNAINDTLVQLYGGTDRPVDVRLTPQQREANYNNWKAQATTALRNADQIYNDEILPFLEAPESIAGDGRLRVVAAAKQAEFLQRIIDNPDAPEAAELMRLSKQLGEVIIQSGSRAGLELAMTRWFDLGGIDWTGQDVALRVGQFAQRVGVNDVEGIRAVSDLAKRIGRRTQAIHDAQDATAQAAQAARANVPKARQASNVAARAARKVRDVGPSEQDFNEALQRIKAGAGRASAGVDPLLVRDAAIVGTYYLKNGVADFVLWSDRMIQTLGERFKPYLQGIWDDIGKRAEFGFDVPKTRVMTLFSGGGVFEQGILNRSVDLVGAVELDPKIANHYRSVYGDHVINAGVETVDYKQFRGRVDHLHASPVCKAYCGVRGARGVSQIDMSMAQATARAIRDILPRSVSIENAPDYVNSPEFAVIVKALEDNGYRYDVGVYNAADYGTPQQRKRLILRAWNLDEDLPEVVKTHGPETDQPYSGWMDTVGDLLPGATRSDIPNFYKQRLGVKSVADLGLQGPTFVEPSPGGPRAPRLFNAGEPVNTIRTGSGGRVSRVIVPSETGAEVVDLPMRGVARLMGLPDSYPLPDNKTLAQTVIGNGVTPQIAAATVGPMLDAVATRKAGEGAANLSEVSRTSGPSSADYNAAKERVIRSFRVAGITPASATQQVPEDLVIIGWYLLNQAKTVADRKFAGWSEAMRKLTNIDDAMLQQVWVNAKYRVYLARGKRPADPVVFVDELARVLKGRKNAIAFLDMMLDDDGSPTVLEKWITGQKLTPDEQRRANDAFETVIPKKKVKTPEEIAAAREKPIGKFKEGRDELRALERALEKARKDQESRQLPAIKAKADQRLADLQALPTALKGQASRLVSAQAAEYRQNASALTAHVRNIVGKYGAKLNPDELDKAVADAIQSFKDNPSDIAGVKSDFTRRVRDLSPTVGDVDELSNMMRTRLGAERANAIIGDIPEDIFKKLATGDPLTDAERGLIARAYMDNPAKARVPAPPTPASQAMATIASAVKDAKALLRQAARAGQGEFENELVRKFGRGRADRILAEIRDYDIKGKLDSGETLTDDDSQILANAIDATRPGRIATVGQPPSVVQQAVLIAQERARAAADLRTASEGRTARGGVDLKSYIPEAVVEFRKGASNLRNFRLGIEKKYPGLFTDQELNDLFIEASKKYAQDVSELEPQKAQIAAVIRQRLRAERGTAEKFLGGLSAYNNIFRALALGQDMGVLFTQGAFTALARPGTLYAGLPSPNAPNKLQMIEQFITGQRGNRRSASTISAMLQAWGKEAKVGEFEAEASALQSHLYGSSTYYKDAGLVLEEVGALNALQSQLNKIEQYRGLDTLSDMPLLGMLYERSYLPGIRGGISPKSVMTRFERATATGLNRMRIAMFETLMERYRGLAPERRDEAAKLVADMVNLMTGRAPLSPEGRMRVAALAEGLTAPEYYVSRAMLSTGIPGIVAAGRRISGSAALREMPLTQRARLQYGTLGNEYARAFISFQMLKTVLEKAGYDVETDPMSPEFGSVKIPTLQGRYRTLDISGGIGPWLGLVAQLVNATKDTVDKLNGDPKYKRTDVADRLFNFIKGKMTIIPQLGVSVAIPSDLIGEYPKFETPTTKQKVQAYMQAPRRLPSGRIITFKDPADAFTQLIGSAAPASMTLRSFMQTLMESSGKGLSKEQQFKVMMESIMASSVQSVGASVGRLKPKPGSEAASEIRRVREAEFMSDTEKQREELAWLYGGRK